MLLPFTISRPARRRQWTTVRTLTAYIASYYSSPAHNRLAALSAPPRPVTLLYRRLVARQSSSFSPYTWAPRLTSPATMMLDTTIGMNRPVSSSFPTREHIHPRAIHSYWTSSTLMAAAAPTSHGFVAPEPPQSSGIAVFPDVELSQFQSPHATLRNSDPNAVFVVNGASRGIGLQFVKHLLSTTKGEILACCRSPDTATGLQEFLSSITDGEQKQRIQLIPLDLEDQTSIENAGTLIRQKVGRVDLLLNVAGILGDSQTTPGPERSVTKIERQWMEKTFQVNVIGPVMFSKELVPLLGHRRSKKQKEQRDNNDGEDVIGDRPNAVIANLSARVGSISDNGLGGWYSYRMSKSALNQATRTLSNELKRQNVWCIALHPGTTDTDLSKPFQKNVQDGRLFPVEFTVGQLKQVIDSLDDVHTGGLYDWAGKAIPF